jgi:hypothetical protein
MSSETATGFTVSFTALLERYGIAQSTLSHRIKQLRLKTKRHGRNVYLSLHQLAQLDDLHRFLQEHPRNTIREFLTLSGNSSTKNESTDRNIESSSESLTNHGYKDDLSKESRGESSQEQQVLNQYAQLADEHRRIINEQRYIINDQRRLLDEQKLEIEELKAELEQMKQQVDSAEREKLMLKHKLGRYKSEGDKYRDTCYRWQNFWENTFPMPVFSMQMDVVPDAAELYIVSLSRSPSVVQSEQSFIWVKTKLHSRCSESDSVRESNLLKAANHINSHLPQFID